MPVSGLARTLANPFYVGIIEWGGARKRTHDHYLKGLLYCGECGRRLSLTLAKGKSLYLYCLGQKNSLRHLTGCTQPYLMADQAEKLVKSL